MTELCPEAFLTFARDLAEAARRETLPRFRQTLAVDVKDDRTPVTEADRHAEARMRDMIAAAYPDHGVIGEEGGADRPEASHVWVMDPIDGTKKFITGNPLWGTLIALLRDGRPILGVIDVPAAGDRWIAGQGLGCFHETAEGRRRLSCRPCPDMARASLYTTAPEMFEGADALAFARLKAAVHFPLYGGECHAYGLLAAGWCDLVIEGDMAIYDYLSHVAIITEAGGVMTDWKGRPLGLQSGGQVIAAGDPARHREALALLAA